MVGQKYSVIAQFRRELVSMGNFHHSFIMVEMLVVG